MVKPVQDDIEAAHSSSLPRFPRDHRVDLANFCRFGLRVYACLRVQRTFAGRPVRHYPWLNFTGGPSLQRLESRMCTRGSARRPTAKPGTHSGNAITESKPWLQTLRCLDGLWSEQCNAAGLAATSEPAPRALRRIPPRSLPEREWPCARCGARSWGYRSTAKRPPRA